MLQNDKKQLNKLKDMTAKEFYDNTEGNIDFTQLTSTGISTDYDAIFNFSNNYKDKETFRLREYAQKLFEIAHRNCQGLAHDELFDIVDEYE